MNEEKSTVRRGDSLLSPELSLNTLMDGVIHEMKNLFNPLFSYPDIISEKLPPESPILLPMLRIKDAAARAYELIQNYIVLTSADNAILEPMDINSALSFCLKSVEFKYLAGIYPEVEIKLDLADNLPQIKGSLIHISCLIMNLIRNSFEAIGEEGELRISTSHQKVESLSGNGSVPEGDYVVLNISDSGKGFSPKELDSLQKKISAGRISYGTSSGIGLTVVSEVVKSHRGYIDIKSEEDEGSSFSIYFRLESAALT